MRAWAICCLFSLGCNAPEPPGSTGGTSIPAGACGRGVVVVSSDYQSSNLSLVDWDGSVLSSSFISSAGQAGLSAKLTGDVVLPTVVQTGEHLVLLDRFPASVLSWVRVADGSIERQLSVQTGFASNPQDYLQVSPDKAYVTRHGTNPDPGQEPFDAGDDILILDPQAPSIVGRIDLAPAMNGAGTEFSAAPARMLHAGERVVVLLQGYAAGYLSSTDSRLVSIDPDTDAIEDVLVLSGLKSCAGLSLAPSGSELSVVCSGEFAGTNKPDPDSSAIVRIEISDELRELGRIPAGDLGSAPLGFGIAHVDQDTLLVNTFGEMDDSFQQVRPDTLLAVDEASGASQELLRSAAEAFTLGDVRCAAPCGACYVTDADRGVIHHISATDAGLSAPEVVAVDDRIGLPPRALGAF